MENTIKQLKQFRVDAIYGKKKHYNAAFRKRKYYNFILGTQIVLNAITGTTLINVVFGEGSYTSEIFALILTIITTIFAGLQKIWNFEKQAQGNAKAADMYLRIGKKINLILCLIKDKELSNEEIIKRTELIGDEISQANEVGSEFPTNIRDYKKAQKGIKNGEENYKEDEIEIWE